jgi:hypothetical protein
MTEKSNVFADGRQMHANDKRSRARLGKLNQLLIKLTIAHRHFKSTRKSNRENTPVVLSICFALEKRWVKRKPLNSHMGFRIARRVNGAMLVLVFAKEELEKSRSQL